MTITDIISRHFPKAKKTANGYMDRCPAHDDKTPSLSLSEGIDGRTLLHCFKECSAASIVSAVGLEMQDLFVEGYPSIAHNNGNDWKNPPKTIVATYPYTDADGVLLYENVRYEPKVFRQRRPDGLDGYINDLDGVERVPYRLSELIEAMKRPDPEVWLTEGEKDADSIRSLGLQASSFKNWTQSFNQYIKGAHVVLFCDNDESGVKQAKAAARIISKLAKSVKVIFLFGDEPLSEKHGKDVSDWIEDRRRKEIAGEEIAEELSILVDRYDAWVDVPEASPTAKNEGHFQFSFTTLDDLYREPAEETAYVWDKTLPVGGFSIISAKPKVGKSTVLRNLAVAIIRGASFLGRDTLKGKVLYLCLEEKPGEVRKQFELMQAEGDMILIHSGSRPKTTLEAIVAIREAIEEHKPVIVFIDPLSRVIRSADFNDYRITYALEAFIDLARETGVHLSALHHDGKGDREGGDALLGSTALFGSVDCHISMKKRQNGRTISSTQRYGEDLPETIIELDKTTGLILDRGDLKTAILAEVKAEVLDNIGSDCLNQADIKERLPNRNGGQVSKAISALVDDGILDRTGTGKRNDPYYYGKAPLEQETT